MKTYLLGLITGLLIAGGVATAQQWTPQDSQRQFERQQYEQNLRNFQQAELANQSRQNWIQQNMLNEMQQHPCR